MFLVPSTRTLTSLSSFYEDSIKIAIAKMLNDIAIQGVATTPLYQLPVALSTIKTLIQMLDTTIFFIMFIINYVQKCNILILILVKVKY